MCIYILSTLLFRPKNQKARKAWDLKTSGNTRPKAFVF